LLVTLVCDVLSSVLSPETIDRLASDHSSAAALVAALLQRTWELAKDRNVSLNDASFGQILEEVLRAYAKEHNIALADDNGQTRRAVWTYPLGVLATDHVGYLSFDLTRLPHDVVNALALALEARARDPNAPADTTIWLYPLARDEMRIDALAQGRFAQDAIVAKLELNAPALPEAVKNLGLLAMQKPDLTDWRLSPSSFAASPSALLGEDGCENLFPANVALQEFYFYQVVGLTDVSSQLPDLDGVRDQVKVGVVNEFRLAWYPLGHSLGQIQYSLPLAPGESVNLAVIDWTRRDVEKRTEDTKEAEQLIHNERRDRTITETVDAAIKEHQSGSSFMGGAAGAAGASVPLQFVNVSAGATHSLGGAMSDSYGSRDVALSTVQKLSDNISQASAAMRELQSTVVVQSTQSEKESIETRTVVNYNHSHSLTILYYEVLRHFRIVTEFVRRRPAVLVKFPNDWFNPLTVGPLGAWLPDIGKAEQNIREHRAALQAALLDPALGDAFDALDHIRHRQEVANVIGPPPLSPPPPPPSFAFFRFEMLSGGWIAAYDQGDKDAGDRYIEVYAQVIGLGALPFAIKLSADPWKEADADKKPEAESLTGRNAFNFKDAMSTFYAKPEGVQSVPWDQIYAIWVEVNRQGTGASFTHIKITAIDTGGGEQVLVDQGYENGALLIRDHSGFLLPVRRPPPPPARPNDEIEDDVKRNLLLEHLKHHTAHYSRAIYLSQDVTDRAQQLDAIKLNGGTATVLEKVENRPLEMVGDFVAYACSDSRWADPIENAIKARRLPDVLPDERLVTLPARGVFAEAKLGHCNASEEIDNTRFWDWQKSPIPHFAPEIAPTQPVTPQPQQANLAPTPFPQSLVNIVNPPAAPDPTGLAAAMNVLATPNIFRDMSGRAEVADLLKKLSDNSVSIAQAANQARAIQAKYGSADGAVAPTGGGGSVTGAPHPSVPRPTPDEQHDQMQIIRNAVSHNNMTPEEGDQAIKDYLQNVDYKERQPLPADKVPLGSVFYTRKAAIMYATRFWDRVCNDGFVGLGNSPWFRSVPGGVFEHIGNPNDQERLKDSAGNIAATWKEMDDCTHFLSSCLGENGGGLPIKSEFNGPYGILGAQRLVDYLIKKNYAIFKAEKVSGDHTSELEPGDIIGYYRQSKGRYTHLALYAGNGDIYCHTYSRSPTCTWDHRWDIHADDPDFLWSFIAIIRPEMPIGV
jgi:hypothetical protein